MIPRFLIPVALLAWATAAFGVEVPPPAVAPQKATTLRQGEADAKARREKFEREGRLPIPADGYTWQQAAAERKLDAAVIARLGRDKLAYGPSVSQSFSPYLGCPVFITSDSLLNAFHVLLEDTFHEYELRQCAELRANLEIVFRQTRENFRRSTFPPPETAPAWRHVQWVVGPALCLLGTPIELFDADVRPEIQAQVAKIRAARDRDLPKWLEPADARLAAIDYRAFRPVGFYVESEKLSDYFRAVRWLQTVPFRGDRDAEVAAIGLLGYGLDQAFEKPSRRYFAALAVVLGDTDTRGLPDAAYDFQNFFSVSPGTTWPVELTAKKRWLIQSMLPHEEWKQLRHGELPANANALLAKIEYHVLPAYRLRDSVVFQNLADRQLEPEGLAVAMMLGSSWAGTRLDHLNAPQVEAAIASANRTDREASVRENSLYDDYLAALRTLSAAPPDDAPAFMRSGAWEAKSTQTILSSWAQMRHTFTLQAKRSEFFLGLTIVPPGFVEPNPEFFSRMADLIERSRPLFDANRDRWDTLASVARKLEALAHKQLRHQPWSREDEKFLKTYGERIAAVMGYEGNSYEVPNDDAPRWADVHYNAPRDEVLAVAVGRPRTIYVLYPWNGMEVLCQGSVMPYYEYHSKSRLTDAEWKQLLDSPHAPAPPAWLRPYLDH